MFTKPKLLDKTHELENFDCGNIDLNDYLKKYAAQNIKKDAAKTFISTLKDSNKVIAYYTLVAGSVNPKEAPDRVKKGLPKYPIPTILIAKFAVDINFQGKGLGKHLLKDSFLRILQASEAVGIRAVHVNAKDEKATNFYKKYDFIESPITELSLYLLLKDLKAMLNQ